MAAPTAAAVAPADPLAGAPIVMVTYEAEPEVIAADADQVAFHVDFDTLDAMRRNNELDDAAAYVVKCLEKLDKVAGSHPAMAPRLDPVYEGLIDYTLDRLSEDEVGYGDLERSSHDNVLAAMAQSLEVLLPVDAGRSPTATRAVYRLTRDAGIGNDKAAEFRRRALHRTGACPGCDTQPVPGALWPAGGPAGLQAVRCPQCCRYETDSAAAYAAGIALNATVVRSADWSGWDVTEPDTNGLDPVVAAHIGLLAG